MHPLSHVSYPVLLFILFAEFFGITYTPFNIFFLVFFAVLPDFDFFYFVFVKKGGYWVTRIHHTWLTHWPITYLPLLVLLFFYPSLNLFLANYGIFFHLTLDLFLGSGIMWFYPFSKKYYRFFAKELIKYDGLEWIKAYHKKTIFKIDFFVFLALIVFFLFKFAS